MAKLAGTSTALAPAKAKTSPLQAKKNKASLSRSGGEITQDLKAKTELFLLSVSGFAGENNYYESSSERLTRAQTLVEKILEKDSDWLYRFIAWLRGPESNIRTMSIVLAAEYVFHNGPNSARLIFDVCQRADEPAEFLAYWINRHYGFKTSKFPLKSPRLPQRVRKGLAAACINLYNPYSAMKYSGRSNGVSMADVLNLVHPKVSSYPAHWDAERVEQQRKVFEYIINRSYGNDANSDIPMIAENQRIHGLSGEELEEITSSDLGQAGMTWEQYGSLRGKAWDADSWAKMIPSMGYMALIRNLRNFEQVGLHRSKAHTDLVKSVADRIGDEQQVAKSRQLPFRFYSALKNVESSAFLPALEDAFAHSVQNIPELPGKTLIMLDVSGSMSMGLSLNSSILRTEVGAVFASALFYNNVSDAEVAVFGTSSRKVHLPKGGDPLSGASVLTQNHGVGHGTDIWGSVSREFKGHDRIVVFTDMQHNSWGLGTGLNNIPKDTPIHFFDLSGYGDGAPVRLKERSLWTYGGFSDSTFKLLALNEAGDQGSWPF